MILQLFLFLQGIQNLNNLTHIKRNYIKHPHTTLDIPNYCPLNIFVNVQILIFAYWLLCDIGPIVYLNWNYTCLWIILYVGDNYQLSIIIVVYMITK